MSVCGTVATSGNSEPLNGCANYVNDFSKLCHGYLLGRVTGTADDDDYVSKWKSKTSRRFVSSTDSDSEKSLMICTSDDQTRQYGNEEQTQRRQERTCYSTNIHSDEKIDGCIWEIFKNTAGSVLHSNRETTLVSSLLLCNVTFILFILLGKFRINCARARRHHVRRACCRKLHMFLPTLELLSNWISGMYVWNPYL